MTVEFRYQSENHNWCNSCQVLLVVLEWLSGYWHFFSRISPFPWCSCLIVFYCLKSTSQSTTFKNERKKDLFSSVLNNSTLGHPNKNNLNTKRLRYEKKINSEVSIFQEMRIGTKLKYFAWTQLISPQQLFWLHLLFWFSL